MKKLLLMFMITALLFSGTVTPQAETDVQLGDVNGDSAVNAHDALLILQYGVDKAELSAWQIAVADVTGNGNPGAGDALCVLQYAVEVTSHFPVEEQAVVWQQNEHYNLMRAIDAFRVRLIDSVGEYEAFIQQYNGELTAKSKYDDLFFAQNVLLTVERTGAANLSLSVDRIYTVGQDLFVEVTGASVNKEGYAVQAVLITEILVVQMPVFVEERYNIYCNYTAKRVMEYEDGRVEEQGVIRREKHIFPNLIEKY